MVEKLLGHIGNGRADLASAMFAEVIDFDIPHHDDVWWIPMVRTRAEFEAFLAGLGAELETVRFDVDEITATGQNAIVTGELEDRVLRTGRSFVSRFSLTLHVEGGEFTRYRFIEDTAAVQAAATAKDRR